ncbi:hypothetical protein [Paenibacillus elgii]|uniref:hypothetical protein n=1 Tax=Paenibacillus elgii TaxID=189691 RepID=UPI000248D910|nr:hypothetical protein [Paenibacillus elgii]
MNQYTPEQITELLEEVNNAMQLGYYPKFEQIKQLTEIVQQQAAEIERLNHVLEQIEHDTEDEYTSEYARANRSQETK